MPILNDIIDWVENKPEFWQVAIDRLIRNNNLSDTDISELKEICKTNVGLSDFAFISVDFNALRNFASNTTSSDNITISKVHNIENINALASTNILEFSPNGLTVVYGDNGAGKSSYVSVLKHICNTRGNKPKIIGNLYSPTTYNNDKKAEVEFSKDGINFESVSLINGIVNNLTLKSVDVFDANSANHYIENEDEIAFIPKGLSIIEKFASGIKKIEESLYAELQSRSLVKFDYLTLIEIPENSNSKIFLRSLNSQTTRAELRDKSEWNKTKEDRLTELNDLIIKLKATDPKTVLKNNEDKIARFKILKNKFKALEDILCGNSLNEYKTVINEYVNANQALKDSSERVFSNLPLNGVGNQSWQILWESARKFYNESKGQEVFPENEGNCPLCLQELNKEAKLRFISFEEFVKNDIQKRCNLANRQFDVLLNKLNTLSFDFQEQDPIVAELDEISLNYSTNQDKYIEALKSQKDYLIGIFNAKNTIDTINDKEIESNSRTIIEKLITDLEGSNEKLKTQSIDEVLKPLETELNNLIGEKKLFEHRPKLGREIYRQKKVSLLNSCIGKCNTRSITVLSNDLTTSYISQSLKDNFKSELRKLGFNHVKIETETKGARGKQYHFLRLDEPISNNVSLKDILSEGEHRCISLATFLSELSLSEHNSSIIFDDPVSSLDHKWRDRIGGRIVEEAIIRQVIVFTHDITFLLMLQEHSERAGVNLEIKSLTRKKKETGIIASNPPWDAMPVGKRIGLLKNAYQTLEKIERTETEEIYKEKAKPLYGKLRETWERFVEEVMLNGAIQRFGREVQTQRIKAIIDLSDSDYSILDDNMSKCSKYFWGHDSSGALIENMPDSSEFLSDIKLLEDFIKSIRERRNKKK